LPLGLSVLGQNRKENYELFILDHCTNTSACSIFIYGAMGVKWTTLTFKELAAQRTLRMDARYWLKRKKKQRAASGKQRPRAKGEATSNELQATSVKPQA
jgi:hypothetical protein